MSFENRSCKRKKKHDRAAAENIAAKMTRRRGEVFHAYKCRFCSAWHVGHKKTPFRMFMLLPARETGTDKKHITNQMELF